MWLKARQGMARQVQTHPKTKDQKGRELQLGSTGLFALSAWDLIHTQVMPPRHTKWAKPNIEGL